MKYDLEVGDKFREILDKAAKVKGVTPGEIIRRSVALYTHLVVEQGVNNNAKKLFIINSCATGDEQEVIQIEIP